MKKVLIIGANCAWQKVLQFDGFGIDKINRAAEIYQFASGKGINFARAMKNYGKFSPCVVEFVGGATGERLVNYLASEQIENKNILVSQETRVCTTCIDLKNKSTTEIIEPAPEATSEQQREFFDFCQEAIHSSEYAATAICGTLINKVSTDLYLQIVQESLAVGKVVLLDSYRNMENIFSLRSNLVILKINRDELFELTKEANLKVSMENLQAKYNFKAIVITDGAEKSYLITESGKFYEFELPELDKLVNPIGSGDTASSILLSEFLSSGDLVNSVRMALGAASANCRSLKCGEFDLKFADDFSRKIKIYER